MNGKRYRVAQWATGHSGMRSLQGVLEHPDFDLVGVYVYSQSKAGRDAGELCGKPPAGVVTTRDIEDIIAAEPDCVLYMPTRANLDDLCRLLAAGANIVTLVSDFHHVASLDSDVRERIEAACERSGASLYATGPSPGWITEIFPLALTALQRRLDRLVIEEFADLSQRDSPEMLANLFGGDPEAVDAAGFAHHVSRAFVPSLRQLADGLAVPLDEEFAITGEVATATKALKIGGLTIEAGTIAAWRFEVAGLRGGEPFMIFRSLWYVTKELDVDWDLRGHSAHVVIDGDAPFDIDIRFTHEDGAWPGYTVPVCLNAVPSVCDAPQGIRTTVDLPRIVAKFA